MPAAVPIVAAVVTAGAMMVQGNQQEKKAEGLANEQKDALAKQQADLKATDAANLKNKANQAGASQKAAIDAIRASMSTSGSLGGTVLTGPMGAPVAPTASKTLLGA